MAPLLQGIRVLDFGRYIAGPYCAAMLAEYGADVIRIERVEGGEDRYLPPVTEAGEGGLYLQMNRNKRCLTLDLAHDDGRRIVRQLVATADVVVANLPPATLQPLLTGKKRYQMLIRGQTPEKWRQVKALDIPGIYSEKVAKRL